MPAKKNVAKKTSARKTVRKAADAKKMPKKKALPPRSAHGVFQKRSLQPVKKQVSVSTNARSRGFAIGIHAVIASAAVVALVFLGFIERDIFSTNLSGAEDAVPVTIGLEHVSPLSLSILFAKKDTAGYVSITNGSAETIHVHLPSSWTRTEVTGTPISEVKKEIPVFGFVRWTLPGKSGMKLLLPESPSIVLFDSTSSSTVAIDLKTIDLTTLAVGNRIVLVQKQGLVQLWGSEE